MRECERGMERERGVCEGCEMERDVREGLGRSLSGTSTQCESDISTGTRCVNGSIQE